MNFKRTLVLLIAATFLFSIGMVALPIDAKAPVAPSEPTAPCVESSPLMAGQNIEVGTVYVERVGEVLRVTFEVDAEGWYLLETHVALSIVNPRTTTTGGIPQTKTWNPIPGKFPLGHSFEITDYQVDDMVEVSLADLGAKTGDCVYVAAHAEMVHVTHNCLVLTSGSNTEWSSDDVTWNDAVPCWVHPSWPTLSGVTWVWSTYETDPVYEYNNVPDGGWYFREQFTLPANAFSIKQYMPNVTADNAYRFAVNDVPLGGDGSMSRDGPDYQEWSDFEAYVIPAGTIVPGLNELQFRAMNYFSSGGASGNPAGLAYHAKVCYDVVDQCESAWAAGCGFKGANWATFFCYKVPGWHLKETIVVPSNSGVGVAATTVLQNGHQYKLVASGTYTYMPNALPDAGIADAEYALRPQGDPYNPLPGAQWIKGEGSYPPALAGCLDLTTTPVTTNNIEWGAFNLAHVYSVEVSGSGSAPTFVIWDDYYGDNSGSLTVEIYEWY